MKMKSRLFCIRHRSMLLLALMLCPFLATAQSHTTQSVLSEHTWHRMSVVREGIYKLDHNALNAMGIDMDRLNPNEIRIFGNPSGALPESNKEERYDDLSEMAIYVQGAEDGRFDEGDFVLFYGQEPTVWKLKTGDKYERCRNPYSDTTYYYICVDSGVEGIRIASQASGDVQAATTVVTEFCDFVWHEEELFSPYSAGQNWFGEEITAADSVLELSFVMPNLVKEKALELRSTVMGRSNNSGVLHFDMWCNDSYLVADATMNAVNDNLYGRVLDFTKQLFSGSDTLNYRLKLRPMDPSHLLFLDYVEIYGWRELICVGNQFPFRIVPSQLGGAGSSVWVRGMGTEYQLWDVSQPLRPVVQEGVNSANSFVFTTDERTERRYLAFKPSAAMSVEAVTPVANQNLHAIAQADMLIITPSLFWEQAQALADYHEENDGLHSVLADVNEIYNEFSTGTPDPTALRDFIRMVYYRSDQNLRYVTLFGKGSHDFRNIRGFGKNFVPTYESGTSSNSQSCYCTDDYFALMEKEEGLAAAGTVDLGIGRLPVSTIQEAETVLRKIFHYDDLRATQGMWKTNHLFLADEENMQFFNSSESCERMLDTLNHDMNPVKVYVDAYSQVSTASGTTSPGAHEELMRRLENGVLFMQYHGHGGVRGLTDEQVFNISHITSLTNYDCMPFAFTATCEFSQFDDPNLVSAGELFFTQPNGGSAAMLTTTRPTVGTNSQRLAESLLKTLYNTEDGKSLRFGDIMRISKSNSANFPSSGIRRSLNICYVFFGDPAMRFNAPSKRVAVSKINGQQETIPLYAMSMVNVEGEIRHADGTFDADFNGEVDLRFFDKKTVFTTLGHDSSYPRHFSFFNDVLFQGKATVTNGKFNISFQVPVDINLEEGTPRFSFYAYDPTRSEDAIGVFEDVVLGGSDPAMVADNEGPSIRFYWDTPEFCNGDTVNPSGTLCADLYDAQGIYHYDFSLGRDIVLSGDAPGFANKTLNHLYEPALDDYRRGSVRFPVEDLMPGTYTFTLRAWDTQNNASEAELWLTVGEDKDVFLAQVGNYPNPFSDETWISFVHESSDESFGVALEVYDVMGRCISVCQQTVAANEDGRFALKWNVGDSAVSNLSSGLYFYRITLTDASGKQMSINQKMLLMR